jgi:predicted amino acid-binding ACT domain protein
MQLFSELIRLPDDPKSPYYHKLPLPWFHRGALSFSSGTQVYLAYIKPKVRPLGEIVASVLPPRDLHKVRRLTIIADDAPGMVSKIVSFLPKLELNIVLAETAVINAGQRHYVDLFISPVRTVTDYTYENLISELTANLRREFGPLVSSIPLTHQIHPNPPLIHEQFDIGWSDNRVVEDGWIEDSRWREHLLEDNSQAEDLVDLNTVVITAETSRRIIRYGFPRYGSMTLVIEGRDRPGAVEAMTSEINAKGLNIFASLVKRGGNRRRGQATFIAVCEPNQNLGISQLNSTRFVSEAEQQLFAALDSQKYREFEFQPQRNEPRPAHTQTFTRRRGDLNVPLQRRYRDAVKDARVSVPFRKIPVFVALRFHREGSEAQGIIEALKQALHDSGCFPVIAEPELGKAEYAWEQVFSKMWTSAGCIAIAFGNSLEYEGKGTASLSMAQEYGFMLGQGKPTTLMVPDTAVSEVTRDWWDIQGKVLLTFPASGPPDVRLEAIKAKVKEWVTKELRPHVEGGH